MRGQQLTFIGPRRRGKIIHQIGEHGTWKGRRGKATLTIYHPDQLDIEGQQFEFTATLFYERITGRAATVVEAIEKLEHWYRERTLQNDPRTLANDRRRGDRRPGRSVVGTPEARTREKGQRAPRAKTRRRKASE